MFASQYNVEVHNCEHFANDVIYGINFSAQENVWWKGLSAKVISRLQPVHRVGIFAGQFN